MFRDSTLNNDIPTMFTFGITWALSRSAEEAITIGVLPSKLTLKIITIITLLLIINNHINMLMMIIIPNIAS